MKWIVSLVVMIFFLSCKSGNGKIIENNTTKEEIKYNYNDTANLPYETERDSGYFKGKIPEKINGQASEENTLLFQFLSNTISKKNIVFLDCETLSHSVFINQKTKTRFDTLRNSNTIITSVYKFNELESQEIKLNGKVIKNYKWNGADSLREDLLALDESSFRHFSFKGNEFYYIGTRIMDGHYGSIHTIRYHLIYNVKAISPDMFMTCRFDEMLFGDADGDENLDYLDFNNSDFCTGVPISDRVTIQLYSCNEKGNFILQKDKKGTEYFIDGNSGQGFAQDSFTIEKHYWPVPLK